MPLCPQITMTPITVTSTDITMGAVNPVVFPSTIALQSSLGSIYSSSAPAAFYIGQLWIDTSNGNKLYRCSAVGTITNAVGNGTTVTYTTDAPHGLSTSQLITIVDIEPTAYNQTATTVASTLTTTTFTVTSGATGTYVEGGWVAGWTAVQDAAIAAAQTTANNAWSAVLGKNTVFYQTTAPSTSGRVAGDVWFDTDDGNKMYGFNGTAWVAYEFGTASFQNASVDLTKLADGSVSAAKLVNGAVTATKLLDGAVTTLKLADAAVEQAKIATAAVGSNQIAAGAVVAGKIAANAVTATEIAAGSITTAKITAGAIGTNELAAGAITAAKISAGAIGTNELAANAVTAGKIAASTITGDRIAAGTITATNIAAGTITTDKLVAGTLTGFTINNGSGTFQVTSGGAMTATSATITGSVTATSGSIAGVTINSNNLNYSTMYIYGSGSSTTAIIDNNRDCTFKEVNASGTADAALYTAGGLYVSGKVYVGGVTSATGVNYAVIDSGGYLRKGASISSERYKNSIVDIADIPELDPTTLLTVPVRAYKYNDDVLQPDDSRYQVFMPGFIAEEMDAAYPLAVEYNSEGEPEAVNTPYLIPGMLALIQQQAATISALEARITALEGN